MTSKGNSGSCSKARLRDKKSWREPVITKVKLNPEQAVLACCSAAQKTQIGAFSTMCRTSECGTGTNATNT